jgi:ATP-binding cassette, subfamily B, bacterial CvaB/MchF/RaxB
LLQFEVFLRLQTMLNRLHLGLWRPRLPMVLQTQGAECGLACLAMVAAHHGQIHDLRTLRQRFAISLKGSTLGDLARISAQMKLQARGVRAELHELSQLVTPCVLHWDLNHFVVLQSVRGGTVVIHDPAHGVRRLPVAQVSRHFTGMAMEFIPMADFTPQNTHQRITLRQLLGHVTGLKRALMQIFVLALGLEVFMLLAPFLMQWVVDDVLVSNDRDLLTTLGLGFGLLVLIQMGTAAIRSWAVLHLSCTLGLQWMGNVFAHLMRLPVAWFERRHMGDVMSRFASLQHIQQTLTTHFVEVILDGLLVVLTLGLMVIYSVQLSLIAVACVAAYGLVQWLLFKSMRDATEESIVHEAQRSSYFLESLRGIQSIKIFNRQQDRQVRFMNVAVDTLNAQIATRKLELLLSLTRKLVLGLEHVLMVWVGALLVMERTFSVGMLFAFLAYQQQFSTRVSALIEKFVELRMLGLQGERLADIVLSEPEPDENQHPHSSQPCSPRLELQNIRFAYAEGEKPVLSGLNLSIEPGESIAIAGPSGCGKTTLLKLMLGIHAPQNGSITVGDVPLEKLGLKAWRDMIGTVMQDDQLFAGSIAENIAFFDHQADAQWIEHCARIAAIHEDIQKMPMDYQTLIGDMGCSLSGGQKQRILLARALYKRPQILFLDEATSALDVEREREVNHAIRQLKITRILVAHRPETIASASRVVVLGAGHVTQDLRTVGAGVPHV